MRSFTRWGVSKNHRPFASPFFFDIRVHCPLLLLLLLLHLHPLLFFFISPPPPQPFLLLL